MQILERYILKFILNIFFGCLIIFIFLYIIIDIFSHLDQILRQQVSFIILKQYYFSYLPTIFVQVSPIAALLATLYTLGRLNKDNEIIAMRASGLSIFQITKAIMIFGLLLSLIVYLVGEKLLPESRQFLEKIKLEMEGQKKKEERVLSQLSIYGLKNRLFYINRFYPHADVIEGIVILEHDKMQNLTKKIIAEKGIYQNGLWKFYKSITYEFDKNGRIKGQPEYHEEEIMDIMETPQEFLEQKQEPEFMNIAQLDNYIWKLSQSGATTMVRSLKVDLYRKFTEPFMNLIIIIMGIPFSLRTKRKATGLSSIGISFLLGFFYYGLNAISIALGKTGILPSFLSACLSHLIVFFISLYLLYRMP
ncbi:MAG: LptF/LptG family permease [Candidatus Omnitrophica bacterium]|nr:LptF/LptG family permease [Candidatus Omnitrophota bacterium]